MSADGKISVRSDAHITLGTDEDRRRMRVLRSQADAVLVGGRTFRNWPLPLHDGGVSGDGPRRRPIINAVLTRRGLLGARDVPGRWPSDDVELRVYTTEDIDVSAHHQRFGARVIALDRPDVSAVLDDLQARGCEQVLVEGGGSLIFDLLAADRLDELYLTVCPRLIGGVSAPTLVDGEGFPPEALRGLRLLDVDRQGDELYLHYCLQP